LEADPQRNQKDCLWKQALRGIRKIVWEIGWGGRVLSGIYRIRNNYIVH